jgi:hypothetical protein
MSKLTEYLLNYGLNSALNGEPQSSGMIDLQTTVKPIGLQTEDTPGSKPLAEQLMELSAGMKDSRATNELAEQLLRMNGPFTKILGAYYAGKARREAQANKPLEGKYAALYEQGRSQNKLAEQLMNWGREDEVDARKRGYAVEDRNAAQAFDINKLLLGAEQDLQKETRANEQTRKQLIFKDFLDRRQLEQKNKLEKTPTRFELGKEAGLKGSDLETYVNNPASQIKNPNALSRFAKDNMGTRLLGFGSSSPFTKIMPASANSTPQAGTAQDGYVFIGGNPADPNNWRQQ